MGPGRPQSVGSSTCERRVGCKGPVWVYPAPPGSLTAGAVSVASELDGLDDQQHGPYHEVATQGQHAQFGSCDHLTGSSRAKRGIRHCALSTPSGAGGGGGCGP